MSESSPSVSEQGSWVARLDAALMREASTRSVSLLRLIMGLILWSRWAGETAFYRGHDLEHYGLSIAFYVVSTLVVVGLFSRVATLLAAVLTAYMVYSYGFWFSHHTRTIMLILALLPLTPCGHSYSLDRWLALRRHARGQGPVPVEKAPQWGRFAIGLMIGAIYFWSGMDKLGLPFMSGERLEQIHMFLYFGSDYPSSPLFRPFEMVSAWFVTALWLVMPVGLMVPRLQRVFIPLGLVLHGFIYYTLPVGTFSVTMWAAYLALIDPDAFHRFVDRMHGYVPQAES